MGCFFMSVSKEVPERLLLRGSATAPVPRMARMEGGSRYEKVAERVRRGRGHRARVVEHHLEHGALDPACADRPHAGDFEPPARGEDLARSFGRGDDCVCATDHRRPDVTIAASAWTDDDGVVDAAPARRRD